MGPEVLLVKLCGLLRGFAAGRGSEIGLILTQGSRRSFAGRECSPCQGLTYAWAMAGLGAEISRTTF